MRCRRAAACCFIYIALRAAERYAMLLTPPPAAICCCLRAHAMLAISITMPAFSLLLPTPPMLIILIMPMLFADFFRLRCCRHFRHILRQRHAAPLLIISRFRHDFAALRRCLISHIAIVATALCCCHTRHAATPRLPCRYDCAAKMPLCLLMLIAAMPCCHAHVFHTRLR